MEPISLEQPGFSLRNQPRLAWRTGATVVMGTLVMALCAHITVPLGFTPVPLTMQTFAVMLLGLVLGPRAAFACMALYLAEGAAGAPVFSPHGPGGLAQLLGPTGGYLLSYPFVAALAGAIYRRGGRTFLSAVGGAGLAGVLILALGALWLGVLTHAGLSALFTQSVAPFLPGEIIKVLAAAGCAGTLGSLGRARREPML